MLTSGCGLVRHWLQPWLWALAATLHDANFGLWACTALAAVWALAATLHNANFGLWACTTLAAALDVGIGCSLLHNANFGLCRLVRFVRFAKQQLQNALISGTLAYSLGLSLALALYIGLQNVQAFSDIGMGVGCSFA